MVLLQSGRLAPRRSHLNLLRMMISLASATSSGECVQKRGGGGDGVMILGEYHTTLCFVKMPVGIKSLSCVNIPAEIQPIKTFKRKTTFYECKGILNIRQTRYEAVD